MEKTVQAHLVPEQHQFQQNQEASLNDYSLEAPKPLLNESVLERLASFPFLPTQQDLVI